jgi:DNA-binding IscR family transcriptional regulator
MLSRDPKEITVGEILRAVGEDILPVRGRLEHGSGESANPSDDIGSTNLLWGALQDHVNIFLDSTTLGDLDCLRSS